MSKDDDLMISRRRLFALAALASVSALRLPRAEAAPRAAVLNQKDYEEVVKAQNYLNNIRTMQSRFDQFSPEGGVASGTIWLQRPGRMRIEYDEPVPILIVADGWSIYYYDKKLDQLSQIEVNQTPAWFLLRPEIKLGGDITLTRFDRAPGALRLTMVETKDPESGSVTLTFSDHPLELKQWTVIDAQKKPVTVTLMDPRFGLPLGPGLFIWNRPQTTPRMQ